MFHNLADNCTVNPNGKLITLFPSEKCTVLHRPLQDATFTAQGGYILPFIFNINKRQRRATEARIKEKYSWQQADKKVIKAVKKSEKIQRRV